jgi:hypothetical protein
MLLLNSKGRHGGRLDPARLTDMSLAALEEVAEQCHLAPQTRSRSLPLAGSPKIAWQCLNATVILA